MPAILLKPGREKSLLRHHPWIFSGAIQYVEGEPVPGETVDLLSSQRQFLARASYSPTSQIRARAWTFEDEPVDKEFFRQRIRSAIQLRDTRHLTPFDRLRAAPDTNAYRLIYAESDGIPGLIVDRYADILVLQSLTAGSEFWKETLADLLLEETGLATIYERSDADVRELEGLEPKIGQTWQRATKPVSTSTSASIVCGRVRWQRIRRYWTVSAIPADSPSMPWRVEQHPFSRSTLLPRRWTCARRTSRSTTYPPPVIRRSREMSSSFCANSAMKAVPST
jgi:hypothetical protein